MALDAKEKADFVNSLCDSIRDKVLARIPHMPEDWDGIELRRYLADEFARSTGDMKGKRKRAYRNTIAVTGAL